MINNKNNNKNDNESKTTEGTIINRKAFNDKK